MCTVPVGPADYDDSLMDVTLLATTTSMTTAELRITIEDEDILERDEDFTIMLNTTETRVNIANSTSVVIVNDDGEVFYVMTSWQIHNACHVLHVSTCLCVYTLYVGLSFFVVCAYVCECMYIKTFEIG